MIALQLLTKRDASIGGNASNNLSTQISQIQPAFSGVRETFLFSHVSFIPVPKVIAATKSMHFVVCIGGGKIGRAGLVFFRRKPPRQKLQAKLACLQIIAAPYLHASKNPTC